MSNQKNALGVAAACLAALVVARTMGCGGDRSAPVQRNEAGLADAALEATSFVDASGIADANNTQEAETSTACVHPAVLANCRDGWCEIPPGCYIGGSPETEIGRGLYSEPQIPITLTRPFVMQQTETTQKDWRAVGFEDPSSAGETDYATSCISDNCPVNNVSWFEALAYANALSEKQGLSKCYDLDCKGKAGENLQCSSFVVKDRISYECRGYRLPMVAEWEYAARAGTRTPFYGGPQAPNASAGDCYDEPSLNDIAWYCRNSEVSTKKYTTHPVALKKPNAWGLFDILGNSAEWCVDHRRDASYGEEPVTNPGDPVRADDNRAIRGGFMLVWPAALRVSNAFGGSGKGSGGGFRLVRTLFP
jgi:formylglycine-generating enzyme